MDDDETRKLYRFCSQLRSPFAATQGFTALASTLLSDESPNIDKILEFVKRARLATNRSMKMIDTYVETGEINLHTPPREQRRKSKTHDG